MPNTKLTKSLTDDIQYNKIISELATEETPSMVTTIKEVEAIINDPKHTSISISVTEKDLQNESIPKKTQKNIVEISHDEEQEMITEGCCDNKTKTDKCLNIILDTSVRIY